MKRSTRLSIHENGAMDRRASSEELFGRRVRIPANSIRKNSEPAELVSALSFNRNGSNMPLDSSATGSATTGNVSSGGASSAVASGGGSSGKQQRALKIAISRVRHNEGEQQSASSSLPRSADTDTDLVSLPPRLRARLSDLFSQIEKEFEAVCLENSTLHRELELLQDKSELTERFDDADGGSKSKQKLMSHAAQKLRPGYKLRQQTSKIVSSFKTPSTCCSMVRQFRGHKDGLWDIHTGTVDQAVIATASADHTARLWSRDTGRCLLVYSGHSGSVNSVRFHPSRELLLTSSGDHTAHVWHAAVVHDSVAKAVSSEDEVETTENMTDILTSDAQYDLAVPSPGGATCAGNMNSGGGGCGNVLRTPLLELKGHTGVVIAADWLSGADQVVTASWDRSGHVYDVVSGGECVNTLAGHDGELTHVSAHPTHKFVVTASRDTTFRLWDFREPIACVSVFQGHTDTVTSAVFTGEDRVVSGSDDRTCRVWDLRNMRAPVATMRGDAAVNRLCVSSPPAPSLVAVPFDNRHIRVYDLSGQRLCRLPRSNRLGHRRMVSAVSWADDWTTGRSNLFSCGFDNIAIGWLLMPTKDNRD